ncbi:hypothetical protein PHLCEN_2v974 [Hermanssonia centrifuga]|uniref:Uncharacterized protein n=1 Tax=Hermanssonia centrifuga TaxID=98765 RepID=A0A2R6S491_9APHY|nr:hypothetical protein PHLCEN_2v974 [Hermanssonia centrifuga]
MENGRRKEGKTQKRRKRKRMAAIASLALLERYIVGVSVGSAHPRGSITDEDEDTGGSD